MAEETRSMARRDFLKAAGVAAGVVITAPALAAEARAEGTTEPAAKEEAPTVSLAATQPVIGSTFALELNGALFGYFSEVTGLGSQSAVVETKMVDSKGLPYVIKTPGSLTLLDIHLRRPIDDKLDLWNWRQLVVSGKLSTARKNGSIMMLNQNYTLVAQWNFINGWPSRIEAPIAAAGNAGHALEEIVLVHEGITRANTPTPPPG